MVVVIVTWLYINRSMMSLSITLLVYLVCTFVSGLGYSIIAGDEFALVENTSSSSNDSIIQAAVAFGIIGSLNYGLMIWIHADYVFQEYR